MDSKDCPTFADDNRHFLGDWCEAVQRLLDEHGEIVAQYPTQVHILDLGSVFHTEQLREMYEKHGCCIKREKQM